MGAYVKPAPRQLIPNECPRCRGSAKKIGKTKGGFDVWGCQSNTCGSSYAVVETRYGKTRFMPPKTIGGGRGLPGWLAASYIDDALPAWLAENEKVHEESERKAEAEKERQKRDAAEKKHNVCFTEKCGHFRCSFATKEQACPECGVPLRAVSIRTLYVCTTPSCHKVYTPGTPGDRLCRVCRFPLIQVMPEDLPAVDSSKAAVTHSGR